MIRRPRSGQALINYNNRTGNAAANNSPIGQIFQKANKLYEGYTPEVMKGIQARLDRSREKSVASGLSNLTASGLANTSMVAGIGNRFEEEIGAPTMASAYSDAYAAETAGKAGVMMNEVDWRSGLSNTMTIGKMSPGILTRDRAKTAAKDAQPARAPASQPMPRLNLRSGARGAAPTGPKPTFSQAFIGDPNVQSATGRNIGTRLTGTYDLGTGKMTDAYKR